MSFAGFNSSKFVKGRLQAALYSMRKKNRQRRSDHGVGGWTPAQLYLASEQGAWYGLRDMSTLFTDAARTTPAAAGGQIGGITDKSGNGAHAEQATASFRPGWPATGPARIRTDFVDDVLHCTLGADCEVWVNTPNGHYRTVGHAGDFTLPLNDCTEMLVHPGLSLSQEADLSAYFGTERVPNGVFLSPDTSVTLNCYAPGGYTAAVIRFIGANGVSVDKTWSTANTNTTLDLNATDGLTAPMAVVPLSLGSRYVYCPTNQLTGSFDFSANPALLELDLYENQLTGSIDLSANTELEMAFLSSNQFTGFIDISANTKLFAVIFDNNQFSGSLDLSANVALGYAYFHTNKFSGSLDLSANTVLIEGQFYDNQFSGTIDLSNNTALSIAYFYNNQFTGFTGTVSPTLGNFRAQDNLLTQAAVDAILAAFDAAGRNSGTRILNLGGTGNAAPSAAGITSKNNLLAKGWTVTTN